MPSSWVDDYYAPLQRYAFGRIDGVSGKKVLEIGCGPGQISVMLALAGAKVETFDIDLNKVEQTRRLSREFGVLDRVNVTVQDMTHLDYPENYFDIVFCRSVLMYADALTVAEECRRVLRDGGKAVFLENLNRHPLLVVYRGTVSSVSKGAQYIGIGDVSRIASLFSQAEHKEYHLLSTASLAWLKVFNKQRAFKKSMLRWSKIDEHLLRLFPFLRSIAWMTALVCTK